jgi:hypothetical protein
MKERLSDARYAIPFGSYQSTQAAEYPANEVLIGREGERAYFLNLLFNQGRRGAFLITGHRGSGKSTFVRYCVEEYRQSCFRRYQSSTVGRAVFWDRILLVVGALIAAATALFLTELLELLGPWKATLNSLPRLSVQLGITLLLSYLFLEGYELSALVMEGGALERPSHARKSARPEARRRFAGAMVFLALAGSLFFFFPLAQPGLAVAWLALAMSSAALVSLAFGFRTHDLGPGARRAIDDDPTWTIDSFDPDRAWRRWAPFAALAAVGGAAVLLSGAGTQAVKGIHLLHRCTTQGPTTADSEASVFAVWSLVTLALAVGYFLRAADLHRAYREHKQLAPGHPPAPTLGALASSHRRHLIVGFVFLGLGFGLVFFDGALASTSAKWMFGVGGGLFAVVGGAGQALRRRDLRASTSKEARIQIHARPRLFVALKAICLCALGLQLVGPALDFAAAVTNSLPENSLYGQLTEPVASSMASTIAQPLFQSSADETSWLFGVVALVILLVGLEREWILRPLVRLRDEPALHERHPKPLKQEEPEDNEPEYRHYQRRLVEQTLVWRIYSAWLPVLTVRVNLGFDELEYWRVVEAMGFGLRQAFRKYFLSWQSGFTIVRRLLAYGVCAVVALVAGDHWFGVHPLDSSKQWCGADGRACVSRGLQIVCDLGGEPAAKAWVWSPFTSSDYLPSTLPTTANFASSILRLGNAFPDLRTDPLDLRVYHLLIFFLQLWLLRRFAAWSGFLPYETLDRRMTRLLEGLSHRLHQESQREGFSLARLVPFYRTAETVERKEGGPFDPRTTELTFLEILEDIQDPATQLLQLSRHRISPPVPEVIFIFDELDKVGISEAVGAIRGESDKGGSTTGPGTTEQQRGQRLHRLFADLKNLLATGEARFLFIGGRNLHDEWLADQSARSPLLTHIFQAEIYLPSLLIDPISQPKGLEGVRLYLRSVEQRGEAMARLVQRRRMLPWPVLELERRREAIYLHAPARTLSRRPDPPVLRVTELTTDRIEGWQERFHKDLHAFLAYRSVGSLKRLQELVEGFVRPADRIIGSSLGARLDFDCHHVLRFNDSEIFRIQLTATIFRSLDPLLSVRIQMRDDKLATGLLYLSDYLLKFHRRAFSLPELERIDELVDVYRAPDLRSVLRQLVFQWSDRYLHRIRNGMYDFRFQSEFAREIEYASRMSELDLAAFNFTLDESKVLKRLYGRRLESAEGARALELIAALGELHEFDEEFEVARQFYRQAIDRLDERFRALSGEQAPLRFLEGSESTSIVLRRNVTWAVERVRLMLQIAMTYERTQDLEQAQIEYRNTRTVARRAIEAMLSSSGDSDFTFTLKHLNILFEPAFAEAWLSEKVLSGVDAGAALLEGELWNLRNRLPFVCPADFFNSDLEAQNASEVRHSNFALILASLHDKAGDLFFFKGRQQVSPELAVEWKVRDDQTQSAARAQGYLLQAQYHYALGLHDLRRFNQYRRRSSKRKLNAFQGDGGATIEPSGWPEFSSRLAAATLLDFADTLLARVSLAGLFGAAFRTEGRSVATGDPAFDRIVNHATEEVRGWLDEDCRASKWQSILREAFPGAADRFRSESLGEWFGTASPSLLAKRRLLESSGAHRGIERLSSALILALTAARLHREAGYPKAVTRESLRAAATVTQLLWWRAALARIVNLSNQQSNAWVGAFEKEHLEANLPEFLSDLSRLAVFALREAVNAQSESGPHGSTTSTNQPNPRSAAVYAAGLGLAILAQSPADSEDDQVRVLRSFLATWYPDTAIDSRDYFRSCLERYLEQNSFPVLNRLFGLEQLVLDAVFSREPRVDDETRIHLQQLETTAEQYGSSVHFTPLQLGLTFGGAVLASRALAAAARQTSDVARQARKVLDDLKNDRFGLEVARATGRLSVVACARCKTARLSRQSQGKARKAADVVLNCRAAARAESSLRQSLEMVTMRRAYYEAISDLYYLFDDFNDRMIHYNHAIQMMAIELTSYLLAALDED